MSAAVDAKPAAAWSPDYRKEVIGHVFAAAKDGGAQERVVQAFGLDASAQPFASLDSLHAAFAAWYSPDKDLHELLRQLDGLGLYPASPTGFRWDVSEAGLKALSGEVLNRSRRVLDGIAALQSGQHTFANTLGALNSNDRICDLWSSSITFLSHVSASKSVRDVSSDLSKELAAFEVEQGMRVDLFEAFKAFAATPEAKTLQGEPARLLEHTLRDFRRNGLHLPAEQRARVEEIKKRMASLGITFSKNLGEENAAFEFTKEQLRGVPDDQLARFPKSADGSKYVVSLKYPSYFPVMEICSVEATRKKLEFEYNRRCMSENTPILEELVRLRAEQARLLGYPTHAAYVLEIRMAKSPDVVGPFLRELSQKLTPLMEQELAYWRQLKEAELRELGEPVPPEGVQIHAYDVRYFTRLSELKQYQVDDQAIKQYFPIEVVTDGLMTIYQRCLGFTFEQVRSPPTSCLWHPDVQLFAVKDADSGNLRGHFYLDLHPREGKYGHAAVWGLKPGCEGEGGKRQLPVAAMVANFTQPTPSQPSLLTHQEVVTYFHEFGHVMHQLCSEVQFARFAGTAVERDFVEAPSQMLENWCYEPEPLLLMSGLVTDKSKKMPKHLLDSIQASKKANAGLFNKRQCILGLFDQYIHTHESADTAKVFAQICAEHWPIKPTPDTNFAAGFGHLAGGYDAQYYGYMWSEVYSADMFESRFKAEGLLNTQTGLSYRKEVISRGGSVDAAVMLRNFLGREPNDAAFLKSKGL